VLAESLSRFGSLVSLSLELVKYTYSSEILVFSSRDLICKLGGH
jgi:hypothetical protein